jgi:hypothetical protein
LEDGSDAMDIVWPAEDGEDGSDADVDVDVGRAVEGVEDDDVLTGFGAIDGDGLFIFFADEHGDAFAAAEAMEERLVGKDIELLLGFALDVVAGCAAAR